MKLVVQWHITEECNWRCTHCYHEGYKNKGPSLEELKVVFNQIIGLKTTFFGNINKRRINFVGGEPFLRKDFIDLLGYIDSFLKRKNKIIYVGILTNGSLLNDSLLTKLNSFKNLKINIQLSIEGREKINDKIRGIGAFKKVEKAIILCKKYNIRAHLSFTLTKNNKEEVFHLINFLEKYEISLKVRRFVPLGQSKEDKQLLLTAKQWYEFSIKVYKANLLLKNGNIDLSGCSEITAYKYNGNGCAINDHRLITILENLDVYPCRRFEYLLGNLKKESLEKIYFGKKYINLLESYKKIDICSKCKLKNICKGGAKCITKSYYNGEYLKIDPQCYRALLLKQLECI